MKSFIVSGAGTGIGRAIAIARAKAKHRELLLERHEPALVETKQMLARSNEHSILVADTRDAQRLRENFCRLENLSGVIANAGVGGENEYGDSDRWDEVIGVNLTGTYTLVNEALPALMRS